jgi:hypothetical protein
MLTMCAQLTVEEPCPTRMLLLQLVLMLLSSLLIQSQLPIRLPGVRDSFSSSLKQLSSTEGMKMEAAGKGSRHSGSHPELQGRKRSETKPRDWMTQEAPSTTCGAAPGAASCHSQLDYIL